MKESSSLVPNSLGQVKKWYVVAHGWMEESVGVYDSWAGAAPKSLVSWSLFKGCQDSGWRFRGHKTYKEGEAWWSQDTSPTRKMVKIMELPPGALEVCLGINEGGRESTPMGGQH